MCVPKSRVAKIGANRGKTINVISTQSKKKPSKIWNAIKVVSDFANPMGGIGKNIVAPKINKQIKKYGTKAGDLLDSVEFILKRKF